MIPTLPLPLRNRLAETILGALHDLAARRKLERLAADPAAAESWLEGAAGEQGPLLRARARCASEALVGWASIPPEPSLDEALAAAASLFDAGLYFEVHELLEPHWARAQGRDREGLQGLIQIAVGYQHLANGNLSGARALLTEGSRRLATGGLGGFDLARFAAAVARTIPQLTDAALPAVPSFPRSGGGTTWISS